MKTFKVTVAFKCKADHSAAAVACIIESLKRAGFVDYCITNAEQISTPMDNYRATRERFEHDACKVSAMAYLDAAILATTEDGLNVSVLHDVWTQVKPWVK